MICEACRDVLFPRACEWVVGHAFAVLVAVGVAVVACLLVELLFGRRKAPASAGARVEDATGQRMFVVVPLERKSVGSEEVVEVTARVTEDVLPRHLVFPSIIAPDFEVLYVRVAGRDVFVAEGGASAMLFSGGMSTPYKIIKGDLSGGRSVVGRVDLALDLPVMLDAGMCRRGESIVVGVRNINCCARLVFATVFAERAARVGTSN